MNSASSARTRAGSSRWISRKALVNWSGDLEFKISTYLGLGVTRYASHDLSPDGEWIASVRLRTARHHSSLRRSRKRSSPRWREERGTTTRRSLFPGTAAGFSPAMRTAACACWDTATWQERPAFGWPAHRSAVTALAVSNDGTLIATSGDETLKLFSTRAGTRRTLSPRTALVSSRPVRQLDPVRSRRERSGSRAPAQCSRRHAPSLGNRRSRQTGLARGVRAGK